MRPALIEVKKLKPRDQFYITINLKSYRRVNTCILPLPCLTPEAASSLILPFLPTLPTYLSIYLIYFTIQVNPRTETSQEASPPHPPA